MKMRALHFKMLTKFSMLLSQIVQSNNVEKMHRNICKITLDRGVIQKMDVCRHWERESKFLKILRTYYVDGPKEGMAEQFFHELINLN